MFNLSIETAIERGNLSTLWYDEAGHTQHLERGTRLIQLVFRAKQRIETFEGLVRLEDEVLSNEAYVSEEQISRFSLNTIAQTSLSKTVFSATTTTASTGLSVQAIPNPFTQTTTLVVESDKATEATMLLYDLHGRKIAKTQEKLYKGKNNLPVTNTADWNTGVYFYTIQTEANVVSGKIVKY